MSSPEQKPLPEPEQLEVALFPIPDVVAFPGVDLPLHVFEPRYRKLVQDCVRDGRMVGVSHVLKTLHQPAKKQTVEQALNSNQATYKPREIFSAGHCEILDTTADGRIIAAIRMSQRLSLIDEVQSLPYRIVSCAALEDEAEPDTHERNCELKRLITEKLLTLVADDNPDLARELNQPAWKDLDPAASSFRIFQYLRFDADIMQTLLETRSASDRLTLIWDILRRA